MYIGEEKGDEIVEDIADEAEKDVVDDVAGDGVDHFAQGAVGDDLPVEDEMIASDAGRVRSADPALRDLRARIDSIDREIIDALATRYRLVEQIGGVKSGRDLPALDPSREALIVRSVAAAARARGIPAEGVRRLFWMVIEYCRSGVYGTEVTEPGARPTRKATDA